MQRSAQPVGLVRSVMKGMKASLLALAIMLLALFTWPATPESGSEGREVFCAEATAIHNRASGGFPDYESLVVLAQRSLSRLDAQRLRVAVKEVESTRRTGINIYYHTGPVGDVLLRLCPDHEIASVVATS